MWIILIRKTFELTSQDYFNRRFNDSKLKFTLFAPSNLAWEKIYRIAPSEYKKLQMGEFGYHVAKIIERLVLKVWLKIFCDENVTFLYPFSATWLLEGHSQLNNCTNYQQMLAIKPSRSKLFMVFFELKAKTMWPGNSPTTQTTVSHTYKNPLRHPQTIY